MDVVVVGKATSEFPDAFLRAAFLPGINRVIDEGDLHDGE